MEQFVVILDRSAGNESVGEMWQETKIFNGDSTLEEVMKWAMAEKTFDKDMSYSRQKITITKPHK